MTTAGTLEKIEEAVKLDEVVKVAKIRALNRFLRQGWVIPTVASVAGVSVGVGVAKLLQNKKIVHIYEETDRQILEVKEEQLKLDFERAERDREFNKQIANASFVSQELSDRGRELLNVLNHMKPGSAIAGEVTVPAPVNQTIEVPQPVHEPESVTATYPAEERPDGDRRLSKAKSVISSAARVASDAVEEVTEGIGEGVKHVAHNIFDDNDHWDYEAERSNRKAGEPYVIHVDEYMNDEMNYENQSTLTWYEKDQILTDSHDKPIYNATETVGELKFGHGSGDPNVVFVRNERTKAEYEILRDPGSYTETVMGEEIESEYESADLTHMNAPRRMRRSDRD